MDGVNGGIPRVVVLYMDGKVREGKKTPTKEMGP